MPPKPVSPNAPDATAQFGLDRLIIQRVLFEHLERAPGLPDEKQPAAIDMQLTIGGRVDINVEEGRGKVALNVVVRPDPKWQPYRIEVDVIGAFRLISGGPEIFDQFLRTATPPILFPYVREAIDRVTRDAAYGRVLLQPVNVQAMLANWTRVEKPATPPTRARRPRRQHKAE